jgi:two-component system, sensor histidine kinase ChiS
LVGNAIKFTEKGEIKITAKRVNHALQITVSDTGIGIPENKLESIFKSFEQGEGSSARKYGGTGLGLAITKK